VGFDYTSGLITGNEWEEARQIKRRRNGIISAIRKSPSRWRDDRSCRVWIEWKSNRAQMLVMLQPDEQSECRWIEDESRTATLNVWQECGSLSRSRIAGAEIISRRIYLRNVNCIYIYIYIYVQMCQKLRSYERKRHSIRFPLTENGSCIYQRACDREKIRDIWTSQPNIRWSISRYLTSASVGGNLTFYVRLPCMSHMFYHTRRNHFVVSTFILKIKASMLQSDSFLERKIIRCERSCL